MTVETIMTREVITINIDETLKQLRKLFDEHQFHHILVEDKMKLVGVISDRDLLKDLSPNVDKDFATEKELARLNRKTHQIMSRKPITVTEKAPIKKAGQVMLENRISCLPVVDDQMKIKGIVTWRDLLASYISKI